jgi:hypothetical protein
VRIARFASFTTDAHVALEKETIALLRRAGHDRTGSLSREAIDAAAERVARSSGIRLSDPQMRAAYHLGTSGRAALLIGAAGVGKTMLYQTLNEAWHAQGLSTVGITRAWRQTQPLTDAGTNAAHSVRQFVVGMHKGAFGYGPGHIVILDEVGQIGTRDLLDIARLQAKHGFRLVATGDHRQGQAIDAGSAIRLFELALGEAAVPELTWTRRQEQARDRETTLMFREGRAAEALARKQEDGTLAIVPGGHKNAVQAVVDLWFERRTTEPDGTIGISAPTNADAMAIGTEIRRREQERGTIRQDWRVLPAIDQRGVEYDLPIAVGDRVRLFQRTHGLFARGRTSIAGNNGSVLTVEALNNDGVHLRTAKGRVAWVEWDKLRDQETGRIKLTYGDALTIDARQGDTLDEHITALPSGSRAIHGLQAYVAASRHRKREWFVTSQGEELAEIIARRPLGDPRNAIKDREQVEAYILDNMARNLRRQPEKTLATDFLEKALNLARGSINAGRAFWQRPERVVERQAATMVQEAAQGIEQQAALAEVVAREPWLARTNLEYWASQVAEGKLEFQDAVRLALAERQARVRAAGEQDIDYGALRHEAIDDVVQAIERYEAERANETERQEMERGDDEEELGRG